MMTQTAGISTVSRHRWLPWILLGFHVLLAVIGLTLEGLNQVYRPVWGDVFDLPGMIFVSVVFTTLAVIGALIISRHPRHPIGWFLWGMGFVSALSGFSFGYAYYGLIAHPGSLPGAGVLVLWNIWDPQFISGLLFTHTLLLFPDGKFLSSRWRIVSWIAIGAAAIYHFLAVLKPGPMDLFPYLDNPVAVSEAIWSILNPVSQFASNTLVFSQLVALVSLIIRLRRSRGEQRQQVKWLVYALSFFPPLLLIFVLAQLGAPTAIFQTIALILVLVIFVGLALAIGLAIFKYRLFEIDILIRRTLVYGVFTTTVLVMYAGLVIVLGGVLRTLVGGSGQISTVISTLTIVMLFTPLRRRVQDVIDRRFYRQKYDAQQALAQFAATVRHETDLEALSARVVGIVEETMQPESASLWLKGSKIDEAS